MEERTSVSAKEFCRYHQIEISFIRSLHDYGLVQADAATDEDWLLPPEQLEPLERMVRLHYDLHINMEGLDAIQHLLRRVEEMQREMSAMRSRLRLYERE